MIDILKIIDDFGLINKGDLIDLSSDLMPILAVARRSREVVNYDEILDILCDAVGKDGTIMVRAFNWDFCHNAPFDRANTPSQTGALGNIALKRKDFMRTKHQLYSWVVKGKDMENLSKTRLYY